MRPRLRPRLPLVLLVITLVAAGIWQVSRSSPPPEAQARLTTAPRERPPARETRPAGPAHDLSVDETLGGHTLARHVGRSDEDLRDRLRRERGISAASTYTDRAIAEATVARTLAQQADRVARWEARSGPRPNLALDYHGSSSVPVGRSLSRDRRDTVPCYDAIVVLRWADDNYYVLTSYPEARR
jgi:toxin YxiD